MSEGSKPAIVGSPIEAGITPEAGREYWTEERRHAAEPVTPPLATPSPTLREAPVPSGETGHTSHGHGSERRGASHHGPGAALAQAVASPLDYPYRTCGKLFFTQNGADKAGSAALVAPNVLLTAGHCVHKDGFWSKNMTFFPSYGKRAATDPAYSFACGRKSAQTSWIDNHDRAHDFGMVWIAAAPGNIVGWLGLLWNAKTDGRSWTAVGYPATPKPPFDGKSMQFASGSVAKSSTTGTIGLTNDNMEHGSSGGPWITTANEPNPTHANGLQSFHITDGDTIEYGPYFTEEVKTLFDWISDPANHH